MPQVAEGSGNVEAVENLLAKVMTEDYSFGKLKPEDEEAYMNGDEEGYFHAVITTFRPKRKETKRVHVEEEGGVWKAKLA